MLKSVEFWSICRSGERSKVALPLCVFRAAHRSPVSRFTNTVTSLNYGAKGLAYIKVNERAKGLEGINSPVAKFLMQQRIEAILNRTAAQDGDMIFFWCRQQENCC
ncbi:GAD domain-containing protein [Shigella flexneri]